MIADFFEGIARLGAWCFGVISFAVGVLLVCSRLGMTVRRLSVGTKSVLFGAHCFFLHPWFVGAAWWRLFSFPWDPRLWVAFTVHDLGYLGKPNMDGPEGETHVELGAHIMDWLFGRDWAEFTARHSRYWSKRHGKHFSKLCIADKLAFVMTPAWLYLPMTRATGELYEYMDRSRMRQAGTECFTDLESIQLSSRDPAWWLEGLKSYTRRWVQHHRCGCRDD